ncbi:Y4bN protein [Mycobacterium tuberculosis]|nr:Y4bN protein [Mycobacterium tuberculosis]
MRPIEDIAGHAQLLKDGMTGARDLARMRASLVEGVEPEGFTICVEGWNDEPDYDLALSSLDADGARLLTVLAAGDGRPERALVWLPFGVEGRFLRKLERFATERTEKGRPKNEPLFANIREIRLAILREFWQEAAPFPEDDAAHWWEVWFTTRAGRENDGEHLRTIAASLELRTTREVLTFPDRVIVQIHATATRLSDLLTTNAVIAEVHRSPVTSEFFSLDATARADLIRDLADRIEAADGDAPAVCLLDTGVASGHRLLRSSVDMAVSALSGTTGADVYGHGTEMAGLSLFDDLASALTGPDKVELRHRLESVKILHRANAAQNADPPFYGVTVAQAAALAETERPHRRRAFSMPITDGDGINDGRPTSWSASVDALAFGSDIARSSAGVSLLGRPDPRASRLFLVSAGNVHPFDRSGDYLADCDTSRIEDPAQAWNVLTVGAFTGLTEITNAGHTGHKALAPAGELSPYSRTSLTWGKMWPVKPDIVMEGGNVLVAPTGERDRHDDLELLTTRVTGDLTTSNATSAATAQAARLGALVLDRYPRLWPETVRGLLVHEAEWTPPMRAQITPKRIRKNERVRLLRRYGWGVPTEERVLTSADDRVTMIVEDEFRPFELGSSGVSMRALRLHRLPWPRDELLDLFGAKVELRVTLSYFVEPNPSNKGWVRYRYPSHQLRFDLKQPMESADDFRRRVSREAMQEEETQSSRARRRASDTRWLIGWDARSRGSLHSDVWTASGAELADSGWLAVVPVGGWWKDNKRTDRIDLPVRYALLVTLRSTVATDIYTPIATEIGIMTETVLES